MPNSAPQPRQRKIARNATNYERGIRSSGFRSAHPSDALGMTPARRIMEAPAVVEPIAPNLKQNNVKTHSSPMRPTQYASVASADAEGHRTVGNESKRVARMTLGKRIAARTRREGTLISVGNPVHGISSDEDEDGPARPAGTRKPLLMLVHRDGKVHGRAARKHPDQIGVKSARRYVHRAPKGTTVLDLTQDENEQPAHNRSASPSADLMEALEGLSLSTAKLRKTHTLPFLSRNLRTVFLDCCLRKNIPTVIEKSSYGSPTLIKVLYKHGDQSQFEGNMESWKCPLCELLKNFPTREMLDAHFKWDHKECTFSWSAVLSNGAAIPKLKVLIPETIESESEAESSSSSSSSEASIREVTPSPPSPPPPPSTPVLHRSPTPDVKPFLRGSPISQNIKLLSPTRKTTRREVRPAPVTLRPERPTDPSDAFRDPSDPPRYPTPPPYENLEGPSAVYPYLPPDSATYSARPDGPKLYDLLNDLPLEPFGLMAWFVIDKEEEIFELDEVRDEDKVMQALWARWIILNRNKFISNYSKGIQSFIDQYWRLIHRAAGFSALRVWLLMLVSNRFLTGSQFCDHLKYYAEKVGMDLWKRDG